MAAGILGYTFRAPAPEEEKKVRFYKPYLVSGFHKTQFYNHTQREPLPPIISVVGRFETGEAV